MAGSGEDVSVKFGADISGLSQGITQAKEGVENLNQAFEGMNSALASIGIGLGVSEIIGFAKEALSAANDLYIFSERTGIAASTLSGLNVPLLQSGSSVEEFGGAIRFMNRNIQEGAEGNKKIVDAFNDIGLSITKLQKLTPEDQFSAIAKALYDLNDKGRQTADGMAVFGRSFITLLPLIEKSHGDINQLAEASRKMGESLTDEQIAKVHEYDDAWIEVTERLKIGLINAKQAFDNFFNPPDEHNSLLEQSLDDVITKTKGAQKAAEDAYAEKLKEQGFTGVQDLSKPVDTSGKGNNDDIDTGGTKDNTADTIEKDKLQTDIEIGKLELENAKLVDQAKVDSGEMSQKQMLDDLRSRVQAQQALEDGQLQEQIDNNEEGTVEYQQYLDKKKILDQQYANQLKQIDLQSAKEQMQTYDQVFKSIQAAADQMVNGILQGTQTWKQAMGKLFDDLAIKFLDDVVIKMTLGWLEMETKQLVAELGKQAAVLSASEAGWAAQIAGATATAGATRAASAAGATGMISSDAAKAAAGVYANVAQIPYVGWLLAPPAAAAAFVAVEAFGSGIASAAGGMEVDEDQLAMVHQNEMILPANLSSGLKSMINGGGAGSSSGGGNPVQVTFSIQAIDSQSGMQFIQQNAGSIAQSIATSIRNGNSSLKSAMAN